MKATPHLRTEIIQFDTLKETAIQGALFAVLDACDAPELPYQLSEWGDEIALSLYRGSEKQDFADFAPYLAHVNEEVLEWIKTHCWEEPWGIFAFCSENLQTMQQHFRKFLLVQDPDGEEMYFRFYDPRVLRKFLPTCNATELRFLFGPVHKYCVNTPETLEEEANIWQAQERMIQENPLPEEMKGKGYKMRIRPPQMAVFHEEAIRILAYEIEDYLKDSHKESVSDIPEDILHQMIMSGIGRASQFDFTTRSSITAFVALMFEFAPNFDDHPRFKAFLSDTRIECDARIQRLIHSASDQDWERAVRNYDHRAWELDLGD